MEYRRLGHSGLKVSALSFGSWVTFHNQVDQNAAKNMMAAAYESGVNFFDNAEAYAAGASEEIMGQALKDLGWSRDSFIVSSKVFWGGEKPTQRGLSRKHVVDACHNALKRLQVDYLDLYFCHRPDQETPVQETVWTMNDLIRQGKVLYWGTSEWSADQIREAHAVALRDRLVPPTMEQPQYHMLHRERVEKEYERLYETAGLGTTIWSPLASGILTGKYNDGIPAGSRVTLAGYEWLKTFVESEEGQIKIEKAKELTKFAGELDTTLSRLAIAWCLKNPRVSTVILGASRMEQLTENLQSLEVLPLLNDEIMAKIELILDNKPTPASTF